MPKLRMLRGLPASGKSTYAKELLDREQGKWKRINKDLMREMLDAGHWSRENEKQILDLRDLLIAKYLGSGTSVIIDDTNYASKHEARLRQLASEWKAEFEVKDFDVPVEVCIERDNARANGVGETIIRRMWRDHVFAKGGIKGEKGIVPAIICDLDGTLALMNGRNPYDASTCENDLVNEPVATVVRGVMERGWHVVFVSGREDKYREPTASWLFKHGFGVMSENLFMRQTGDKRKDYIVKQEIYEQAIHPHFDVKFVLDDRQQVVDMWRSIGLTCFQVALGEF